MERDYKQNITKLKDTINIPIKEDGSPMVVLNPKVFRIEYKKPDMKSLFGDKIYVRKAVADKLLNVQNRIKEERSELQLLIVYGYRTPEVQQAYFSERIKDVEKGYPYLNDNDKREMAHSMSADPNSAGHTVGGAVDITLWDNNKNQEVDMGSAIVEFGDIAYTFYPNISEEQKNNRLYLYRNMLAEGFAPFLGEWWHFSYGDKEWAFYYKKLCALYDKIELDKIPQ